ncbi:MAG TPA: hypothetical protein VEV38_14550 [Candidatus Eremiobacteraceae bacterium]|nr:hypothetical protein [Candidatus Eremiobacteraceae bacterium]
MSFDWTLVNVAISLVAVYLSFSLLASWVNEQIAAGLRWRSGTLSSGILRMLDDVKLRDSFYAHPLIVCACSPKNRPPSYISPGQFSMALIGTITEGRFLAADATSTLASIQQAVRDLPDHMKVKQTLIALLNGADGDLQKFQSGVERWFDDQMTRVSGWYRRLTVRSLFIIGAVLVVILNVDTIKMIPAFGASPIALNCQMQSSSQQGSADAADLDCVSAATLQRLRLGWSDEWTADSKPESAFAFAGWGGLKLLGVALTACAIALGAPFWFDILKQLVNVRNAGERPAASKPVDEDA